MLCVVHLRKRKSDHGKLKAPSTSSITYWQIEKDEEPLSGKTHMKKGPYIMSSSLQYPIIINNLELHFLWVPLTLIV